MAGAGWKDFVPGEVLAAADVQDYLQDQSVMVFASAAARTSALASPSEGMVTYLKDTDTVERFDGSSWVAPWSVANGGTGATTVAAAQDSLRVGLVPISPTSVAQAGGSASANTLGRVTFTTVTSLSLNGVFTSTYDKYRIVMRGTVTGTDIELRFRMRAAGTDNSANSYLISYWVVRSNGTTGAPSGTATSGSIGQVSSTAMGGQFTSFVDLNNPSDASRPQLAFNGSGGNSTFSQNNVGGATLNVTSAFDGITFFPASGSMNGTIQVFGYND